MDAHYWETLLLLFSFVTGYVHALQIYTPQSLASLHHRATCTPSRTHHTFMRTLPGNGKDPYHPTPRDEASPSIDEFPPGDNMLKDYYRRWLEWEDYNVRTETLNCYEIAAKRPECFEMRKNYEQFLKLPIKDRHPDDFDIVHCWEMELEGYEQWLEDTAHFENIVAYVECLEEFLQPVTRSAFSKLTGKVDPSTLRRGTASSHKRYLDLYTRSKNKLKYWLSSNQRQMEILPNHKATGLRRLTLIIDDAFIRCFDRDCESYCTTDLRSFVEFCLPLLKRSLPDEFEVNGSSVSNHKDD